MPGPTRSVLLRLETRTARRLCRCAHNKHHAINKGELRLVVRNRAPASPEKGYCTDCAKAMLDAAANTLERLHTDITESTR